MSKRDTDKAIALFLQAEDKVSSGDTISARKLLQIAVELYSASLGEDAVLTKRARKRLEALGGVVLAPEPAAVQSPAVLLSAKTPDPEPLPSSPVHKPARTRLRKSVLADTYRDQAPQTIVTTPPIQSVVPVKPPIPVTPVVIPLLTPLPPPEIELLSPTERLNLLEQFLLPLETFELLIGDSSSAVRRVAALRRNAPHDLLDAMRRASKLDLTLPAALLERLSKGGRYARTLAARHPNTPPELLPRLAALGAQQAVSQNPSSAPELLMALMHHPDLWRWLAGNPALPSEAFNTLVSCNDVALRVPIRLALARNPRASSKLLMHLATDEDWEVREALGDHPSLTPDIVALLAESRWDNDVREAAARHPHAPPKVLARLATDSDDDIRLEVARHGNLEEDAARLLAGDRDVRVRIAIAANLNSSREILDALAVDTSAVVRHVVQARDLYEPRSLNALAADRNLVLRTLAAAHPATPPGDLERLMLDRNDGVRAAVAANPSTPESAWRQLETDRRWDVRTIIRMRSALERKELPKPSPDARVRRTVAGHALVSQEMLGAIYANDPNRSVRLAVATNPNASGVLLQSMLGDEVLRSAVIRNPSANESILQALERIEDAEAENEQSHELRLRRRALSKHANARVKVAANPSAPEDLLRELGLDDDVEVRVAVLKNKSAPDSALIRFAGDNLPRIRSLLARRKHLPHAAQLRLAGDSEGAIRTAIIGRSDTTEAAMLRLLLDTRPEMLLMIANHPRVTPAVLVAMCGTQRLDVQMLIANHPLANSDVLKDLAHRAALDTLVALISHKNTDISVLRILIVKARRELDDIIVSHPSCDAALTSLLAQRYQHNARFTLELVTRLELSALDKLIVRHAKRFQPLPRWWIFRVFAQFHHDRETWLPVMQRALERPELSSRTLLSLAGTDHLELRAQLRRHPNADSKVRRALAQQRTTKA